MKQTNILCVYVYVSSTVHDQCTYLCLNNKFLISGRTARVMKPSPGVMEKLLIYHDIAEGVADWSVLTGQCKGTFHIQANKMF